MLLDALAHGPDDIFETFSARYSICTVPVRSYFWGLAALRDERRWRTCGNQLSPDETIALCFGPGVSGVKIVVQVLLDVSCADPVLLHVVLEILAGMSAKAAIWMQEVALVAAVILLTASWESVHVRQGWRSTEEDDWWTVHVILALVEMHGNDRSLRSQEVLSRTQVSIDEGVQRF